MGPRRGSALAFLGKDGVFSPFDDAKYDLEFNLSHGLQWTKD